MASKNVAPTWWVGLDVAKQTLEAAVHPPWQPGMTVPFSDLHRQGFPRTREGVGKMLAWLDSLGLEGDIRAVMEATGNYSIELAGWLVSMRPELAPAIADPKKVSYFFKSLGLRSKTDRIDAAALSRFGAERVPAPWQPPTPEYAQLQQLSRQRTFIVEAQVAARNRMDEIRGIKAVAEFHQKHIDGLVKALDEIEEAMRRHVESHAALREAIARLDTIPGVGFITAATILGELGDLTRFTSSRSLSAFSGTAPKLFDSGTSIKKKPRMSKQGSPRTRQALYLAAMAAVRTGKNALARFYAAMVAKGKPKMAALGAVMRKLLVLMRALLVHGTCYRENSTEKNVFAAA